MRDWPIRRRYDVCVSVYGANNENGGGDDEGDDEYTCSCSWIIVYVTWNNIFVTWIIELISLGRLGNTSLGLSSDGVVGNSS